VSRPANCIPFLSCDSTLEAASFFYLFGSYSGCRLQGYLIPFATYTLVYQCQDIYRAMPSPLLFPSISLDFIPLSNIPLLFYIPLEITISSLLPLLPPMGQPKRNISRNSEYFCVSTLTLCLFMINNAIPSVLPRLLAQIWPGFCCIKHSIYILLILLYIYAKFFPSPPFK